MCGEHHRPRRAISATRGSSPHVRGALRRDCFRTSSRGIIPACAGSTTETLCETFGIWDHPRMCGEHMTVRLRSARMRGSSPHVRGALHVVAITEDRRGIIPACAGSTSQAADLPSKRWDHPRMCGEHIARLAFPSHPRGSSPHVRGARLRD